MLSPVAGVSYEKVGALGDSVSSEASVLNKKRNVKPREVCLLLMECSLISHGMEAREMVN
jgi:hypothetical protein